MKRLRRLLSRKTKSNSVSPPDSPDISKIDPPLRLNLDDNPKDESYFVEESLLPCAVCGRTFAPLSLAKHVSICLKTVNKKRKQFDSLSQRVKGSPYDGTELQNYIPKNFESTPHTERERSKTPPASSRMASKSKAHNPQPTHSRLLATAEKTPCPHCGRSFGARALDRHVTFCAEQTRLARAPGASSGPDNVRVARERLMARTSYRAPLGRSKRSMTREKYSLSRSASEGSGMSDNSFEENRAMRGKSEEYKHLPSITKTPLRSSNVNGSSQPRNQKKTEPDDSYDPYLAAERQLRDLMSSASNLTKLDLSLSLKKESSSLTANPKSIQNSPSPKNALNNNGITNSYFQRSKSLRSPSKSSYAPEIAKKYSSPSPKPSIYSLNAMLSTTKPVQSNESLNKVNKLNAKNDNLSKPKNDTGKYSKPGLVHKNPPKLEPVKLEPVDKYKRKDDNHNDYSMNSSIISNNLSESQESFIDPRIMNKDQPLPISVHKFLDNPDLLSSEESLIRESLSNKYSSYSDYVKNKEVEKEGKSKYTIHDSPEFDRKEPSTPVIDDLSAQYDKIMVSLEKSMNSNLSMQDEDSLYNDLEELMSSMDGETSPINSIYSFNTSRSRSTAKDSMDGLNFKNSVDSNMNKDDDRSKPKNAPYDKSISLNFSPMVSKSSSKTVTPTYSRSKSLFDSNQAKLDKKYPEVKNTEYQFEEDIKQSLRELDKLCESNLSDTDSFGGFLSMKKRENYYNENHHYTNDADISQYLPKNLGLSEESPFSDKDNNLPKNRANESQEIRNKLLEAAKNICCPSCGHNFDIRAWVTEQVRLAKESQEPILNTTKRPNVMSTSSRMNNYHHTPIHSTLY